MTRKYMTHPDSIDPQLEVKSAEHTQHQILNMNKIFCTIIKGKLVNHMTYRDRNRALCWFLRDTK